ncbi:Hsp70 family protein [Catenuloplanes japonicus]|uniref:Hsp70 family protein n=1 Tax=Catenuloplanes japonicus TaxID=33876 RepID=UPI0018DD4A4E|nr:Hsp70 family protein [Catenuloplanes japonicus]
MTHLCIDFGTSSTVAVFDGPLGVRPVLFDGAPSLPSGVCADPGGRLLVGPDAAHAARTAPESYEPYPKQRIDEQSVLLGGVEVAVPDMFAAVLRRVADQVQGTPDRVTITHPAAWGKRRRDVLLDSAARAGLRNVRLVSEPVAAAAYFASTAGTTIPVGGSVVVCDLGAGTYDASVIRRTGDGFALLATSGLSDGGGLDLDAAIVAHLGAVYAPKDPAAWARLTAPADAADRRASRALWADVRTGKEMLSRSSATHIHLPLLEVEAPLGREQFEALARPVIDRTVATTRLVLREAGVEASALKGVLLVGGASRVPLVASMLHRALSVAPAVIEQPELAVANGAVTAETVGGLDADRTARVTREQVAAALAGQVSAPPAYPASPSGPGLANVLHAPPVTMAPLTPPRGAPAQPVPSRAPQADDGLAPTRPYSQFEVPGRPGRRATGAAAVPAGPPPRKKRRWPVALVILLVLAAAGAGYVAYGNRGDEKIGSPQNGPTSGAPSNTPAATPSATPVGTGPRNNRGEPLDPRVVQAVKEANPDDPDAYLELPGTDYSGPGPFLMVVDSASTAGGHLKLRIREAADKNAGNSDGLGPLWIAPAEEAEIRTINGGPYALNDFAADMADPSDAERSQVWSVTFGNGLAIATMDQQ